MKNLKIVNETLGQAFGVLDTIARQNGTSINSVTIDVNKSDLSRGKIVGTANVRKGRKRFSIQQTGRKVNLEFMGTKLAA